MNQTAFCNDLVLTIFNIQAHQLHPAEAKLTNKPEAHILRVVMVRQSTRVRLSLPAEKPKETIVLIAAPDNVLQSTS